ncbi:hypothetical protein N7490_003369 [Penicillium lividum]|nr:hypothetical protein N7490_003369 [Penicillium lividum]
MYSHIEAPGSSVTAVHCKAQSDLPIVDRLLEPQTVASFLGFAFGGPLPNGNQPDPSITRLTIDEFPLIQQNFPPGSTDLSILDRVTSRIGSEHDSTRLCLVGKNIHSLKSRLWEGILPLCDQRWKEKGLDDLDKFDYACHHLSAVVAVFEYLNTPIVRKYLRETFNHIYDHWASADVLLNARRAQNGLPEISFARLWTMYMSVHFEVMAHRAHVWVSGRVEVLRATQLQGLRDHQLPAGVVAPDRLQWTFMDNLHVLLEVAIKADYMVMIPMEGYKGYAELYPEHRWDASAGDLHVADCERRGKAYAERFKARSHQIMFENMMPWNDGRGERSAGEGYRQSAVAQVEAQDEVRKEMRGAMGSLPREPWITSCLPGDTKKKSEFGLTIYRLTYGQSEAEWMDFVQKLEAHISDWGDGQTGSHLLKPHLHLCWVDGKEHDIAEGDIEAAKRHFNKTNEESDANQNVKMQDNVFLAVDSNSFASYTTKSYRAATCLVMAGDFSGFVLAVDPKFDPKEGIERPDESPGYIGQMRILGSLVWGDLFAHFKSQCAILEDLWPLAIDHPNQVYVGAITPLQVYVWRKQNAARWIILREVVEYAKRKMGGTSTSESDAPASTSTAAPQPKPTQATESSGSGQTPELDPVSEGIRQYMLQNFQHFLRQRGADREAAVVDTMLPPPGRRTDASQLGQLLNTDMQRLRRQQDGVDGDAEDENDDIPLQCPPQ